MTLNTYRLLPDNRVQISSHSAVTRLDAPQKKYEERLIGNLHRKSPALLDVEIDYSWWGCVDVSHNMMPSIHQPNASESVYYALGFSPELNLI